MRTVVFVAPYFLETTLRFVQGAAELASSRMALVSCDPLAKLPPALRRRVVAHERITNPFDVGQLVTAMIHLRNRLGSIDRLLGTLEQLQEPLAETRDRVGIPGMGLEAARNFRDKARMKQVLRARGVPCARHRLVAHPEDARAFAREVGFPLVIKPPDGAGAKGTHSVADADALREVLARHPPHPRRPLLAEEFIQGSEHSFDAVWLDGRMVWHSLTHYLPTPLDVVRNPWMQWCVLLPREVDDPAFDDIRRVARGALEALGMTDGVCHMEWFRRRDGSIAISEVGARPGGAQISKLISYAHDMNFYRAWGRIVVDGTFTPPTRRYAAGAAFLRGQGTGRVKTIHGLEAAQKEVGPLVVETNLPRLGQAPTGSYEGEGFAILRHPETRVVEQALHRLISLVRVELG